jgi:hypothetical protein
MTPTELILAFMLTIVIVTDVKFPPAIVLFLGSVPGFILILGAVFFLFTQSATLGVLGVIAGFMLLQQSSPKLNTSMYNSRIPEPLPEEQAPVFAVTLEENVVRNIIPMVNNSPSVSFANSCGELHNAASLV